MINLRFYIKTIDGAVRNDVAVRGLATVGEGKREGKKPWDTLYFSDILIHTGLKKNQFLSQYRV